MLRFHRLFPLLLSGLMWTACSHAQDRDLFSNLTRP
jgi:hypothetical protein